MQIQLPESLSFYDSFKHWPDRGKIIAFEKMEKESIDPEKWKPISFSSQIDSYEAHIVAKHLLVF